MSFFDYDDHYNDDDYELSETYQVDDDLAKICDAAKKMNKFIRHQMILLIKFKDLIHPLITRSTRLT